MDDFDSPWKDLLDAWFEDCLAFFFPDVHAIVDWSQGWTSLEQELRQLFPDSEVGDGTVDKLVRVSLRDGKTTELYVHIEVQNQRQKDFPLRMYQYHYRIFDRHREHPISVAILGDESPSYRPSRYVYNRCGCGVQFDYRIAKLLDFAARRNDLESETNPFAIVVLAHLATLETRHDDVARGTEKFRLVRQLFEAGMSRDNVRQLFRFLDWVMVLPKELEQQFRMAVNKLEEKNVPYVSTYERIAGEEGRAREAMEILQRLVNLRFPAAAESLRPRIEALNREGVQAVTDGLITVSNVTEFEALIHQHEIGE